MVRDGLADESGAKLIEQRGIDFAPTEDFIQSLKTAGASGAFLAALRAATRALSPARTVAPTLRSAPAAGTPPLQNADLKVSATKAASGGAAPANAKKPINQIQVFALLAGQVPRHRVAMLVQERGVDVEPEDEYLREVRLAGGEDELISTLKTAKVTKPEHMNPTLEARQAEIQQHLARAGQLMQDERYADAEAELRAALRLNPRDADVRAVLGQVLVDKGDLDGAIAELRRAVGFDARNESAHVALGDALARHGDWDGAVGEFREAERLNPQNPYWHSNLVMALGKKGDVDGKIAEYEEALRLDPQNTDWHCDLGAALGDKGDLEGAIREEREAVRLDGRNYLAHTNLGLALGWKGNWDEAIAEEREALRLNPDNDLAHYCLGYDLEAKGDRQGALREYRTAYELNPKDPANKLAYERLLRQLGK